MKFTILGDRASNEQRETLKAKGIYVYGLRSWDEGDGMCIEPKVLVNHIGDLITNEPIDLGEDNYIEDGDKYLTEVNAEYDWKFFEPFLKEVNA